MNALHSLVIQPQGRERLKLLAERDLAHEAWVNARNRARVEIQNARRIRRMRDALNAKLRDES